MNGWGRNVTYAWPSGVLKRINETKDEVGLYTFHCFGGWSGDRAYNEAEYNIYRLPDLKEFDGVIMDMSNVFIPSVREEVFEKARNAGIPAFSLSMPAKGCYFVGINNHEAMSNLIGELYRNCGCRDFWCLMGSEDNYESVKRTQAITDFAQRMEIDEDHLRIVHGDFGFEYGYDAFVRLYLTVGHLPDVVICVNDNVALGVCEAAKAKGLNIPDDFFVTGFDDMDKAAVYLPRISTVRVMHEDIGYLCMECMQRIWNGETIPEYNYAPTELFMRESCKCEGEQFNFRGMLKDQSLYGIYTDRFEKRRLLFESKISSVNQLTEAYPFIDEFQEYLNCSEFYIVVDGRLGIFTETKRRDVLALETLTDFYEVGYPDDMMIAYAHGYHYAGRKIQEIFPAFDTQERGQHFLFAPFHFGRSTIGYFVIGTPDYLMENQYISGVLMAIQSAAEQLYKKSVLEYMNVRLLQMAETDALTGIYNRTGYEINCEKRFRELTEQGEKMLILFVDMDRLKYINDTFGHGMGDLAIKGIAEVLSKYRAADGLVARIGGDEYVLVERYTGEDELQQLIAGVSLDISSYSQRHELPFRVSASIGTVITDPESGMSFEEYVKVADRKMYEDKLKKESQRI